MVGITTRKDIRKLSTSELDNLIKAFAAIQKLKSDDPDSFFNIAGLHGEPFRGAGYGNPSWWGGYCNHGNVLFPTWHRAYLLRLEQALQKQVPGVALPYWDEIEDTTRPDVIPAIFLQRQYTFEDKTTIDNPLFSYKFQRSVFDRLAPIPDANYTKPKDYQTVRYPFSGLVGTDKDKEKTRIHNETLDKMGEEKTDQILNENVKMWLNLDHYENSDGDLLAAGVKKKYEDCLNAPNYTVFSNTTSAQRWNDDRSDETGEVTVVSLEKPHNSIHLALGGSTCHSPSRVPSRPTTATIPTPTATWVKMTPPVSTQSSTSTTASSTSFSGNSSSRTPRQSLWTSSRVTPGPTPSIARDPHQAWPAARGLPWTVLSSPSRGPTTRVSP